MLLSTDPFPSALTMCTCLEYKVFLSLCEKCLRYNWSNRSCNIMQMTFCMTPYAHCHWGLQFSSPFNWIERQKFSHLNANGACPLELSHFFFQIDPGELTSLLLMETELLMPVVIWSVGSETTSPPPHTIAGSIPPLQPLPPSISQHLLFNEGKQRRGE